MLDTTKPIATIVNGAARTGKTTMLQYLRDTHGDAIAIFEPGRALKTHYMITHIAPQAAQGLGSDAESYLFYMQATQDFWVKEYEKLKEEGKITRDMIILYAESIRAIAPNFFIDLAAHLMILTEDTKLIWAESINAQEFWPLMDRLIQLVGLYNTATVRLECENPDEFVTGDTRAPITVCKNVIKYKLHDSKQVAENIFNNRVDLANVG